MPGHHSISQERMSQTHDRHIHGQKIKIQQAVTKIFKSLKSKGDNVCMKHVKKHLLIPTSNNKPLHIRPTKQSTFATERQPVKGLGVLAKEMEILEPTTMTIYMPDGSARVLSIAIKNS